MRGITNTIDKNVATSERDMNFGKKTVGLVIKLYFPFPFLSVSPAGGITPKALQYAGFFLLKAF